MKPTTRIMRLLSTLALPALASAALDCHPEGPVVPKPVLPSLDSSQLLSDAAANLSSILDNAIAGSINAGWDTSNVSFSLALVSKDQEHPGVPLWEYHHLSKANTEGTKELGRDAQYLVGSVSKLVSDYVLLQTGVDIDVPVTTYIPELGKPGSKIKWDGITLRMLGSHLAGVPANFGFSEYYYLKEVFLSAGLPPIEDSEYPPCGVIGLNGACEPDDYINGMRISYSITALNERPAYSNVAFTIMFMALENVTGKNYTQLVDEHFSKPLHLKNTFPSPGEDNKAVIPPSESSWGADYGYNAPGGGLVSSLADLSTFARGILSRTIPMTHSSIRAWMKPSSFTGGTNSFVGMPWEIHRPTNLIPGNTHPITVHSKGGGAQGYRTQWSLVEEYGIGIIVLAAGPAETAVPLLHGAMMSTFVPAVDKTAREQARVKYAHSFKSPPSREDNNTTGAIRVTVSQDENSLVLRNLTRDDKDISGALLEIFRLTVGQLTASPNVIPPLRLFPGGDQEDEDVCITLEGARRGRFTREVWRIWPDLRAGGGTASELPGGGSEFCMGWMFGDWVHYGGEPLDRVLFYRDENASEVVGFEAPFLRTGFVQVENE